MRLSTLLISGFLLFFEDEKDDYSDDDENRKRRHGEGKSSIEVWQESDKRGKTLVSVTCVRVPVMMAHFV